MDNKFFIGVLILIFMFTTVSLSSLLCIYYITPNTWVQVEKIPNERKILKTKTFTLKSHEEKPIYLNDDNLLIISNNENLKLQASISNNFKSETIYIDSNDIIKLNNSIITIKNTHKDPITISVKIY